MKAQVNKTWSHDELTLRVNSQQHINIESKFYRKSIKKMVCSVPTPCKINIVWDICQQMLHLQHISYLVYIVNVFLLFFF
jgi:hypothetical protein